jgi:hypothetical protein
MAPIDLDFIRPAARRWRWLGWLVLAAVAALAAWLADSHSRLQERLDALEARNDALSARLHPKREARSTAPSPETTKRVQRANAVIQRLTLPWEALFNSVEAADSRSLALLSLEPNARELSLRLTGEASSVDEVLAYVDRLARQRALAEVHLLSFDTVQREGAPVIAFVLSARWLPQ